MPTLTVRVEHDQDTENPLESHDGAWKLYSFGRRHDAYKDPEELGLSLVRDKDGTPIIRNPGLRRKLQVGLAFFLSYFEHGQCVWSLRNEGPQCRWDSVSVAGLFVWEHPPGDMGAKTYKERAADARAELKEYTAWCNGDCAWYCVEDGKTVDSCGGFIGPDYGYMWEAIREAVGDNEVRFEDGDMGSASDLEAAYEGAKEVAAQRALAESK